MAWNRPSEPKAEKRGGKQNVQLKRLLAGLVVIICAGVVTWLLYAPSKSSESSVSAKQPSRIREVEPAPAKTNVVSAAKKPLTNEEKLKRIYDRYGDNIPENLKATVYFLKNPPQKSFHPARTKNSIFKHHCERMVASVLDIEPGEFIFRRPVFGERFDREFAAAMKDPTQVQDSDTDEQRELKEVVSQTMADMAKRVKAGEKASDIMTGAVDDLYSTGKYRRDLEMQLTPFRLDEKYTDQDISDFGTAANEMLQKKGAKPLSAPRFTLRRLMLKKIAQRKAQDANATPKGDK